MRRGARLALGLAWGRRRRRCRHRQGIGGHPTALALDDIVLAGLFGLQLGHGGTGLGLVVEGFHLALARGADLAPSDVQLAADLLDLPELVRLSVVECIPWHVPSLLFVPLASFDGRLRLFIKIYPVSTQSRSKINGH